MNKIIYPAYYTEDDRNNYDALIAQGQLLIGKKIAKADEFLLDLSAKMAINKIKGYKSDLTDEEIIQQMRDHKEALKENDIITPEGLYEDGHHPLQLNPFYKNEAPENNDPEPYDPKGKHPMELNILE
jgi:hypothetical protein